MVILMKVTGKREWNMGKVVIFGWIKLYIKEAFGLIKGRVRERYNTKLTVDMKDTGETIKDKDKAFSLKIIQLLGLLTDINKGFS